MRKLFGAAAFMSLAGTAAYFGLRSTEDPEVLLRDLCRDEIQSRTAAASYREVSVGAFETGPADLADFMGWADAPADEEQDRAAIAAGTPEGQALESLLSLYDEGSWTVARLSFVWGDSAGTHAARCSVVVPGETLDSEQTAYAEVMLDGRSAAKAALAELEAATGQ
jgi:hypothetical protein